MVSAVERRLAHAAADSLRILNGDPIARCAVLIGDLKSRPGARDARIDAQRAPRTLIPRMPSAAVRYIQPAEPVYHVQPPRPTCAGAE